VAGLATRAATLAAAVAAAAGAAGAAALTTLATVRRAAARTVTTLTQLATDLARTATTAARRAATSATSATSAARRAATTMTTAARRALTTTTAARAPIRTTALTTFATVRRAAARTLTSATRLATDLARTATTTVRRAATSATTAARRTATSTTTATRHVATTATARLRGGGSDLLGDARRRAVQLRAVVARVPARAVPVSLLVLVVAAGGSLALRAADAGRDDAAAAIPDPSTPVAPILPPSSPGPLDGPPPEPEPEPVAPVRRPPSLLRIPSIGVDALTVPVGLEADGSMEIPSDVRTIGWYEPGEGVGVAPGQTGTAVLAGHVDSRTQGAGAFYHLRDLVVGDEIEIEHADGTVSRWRVISVTQYAKDALPIDEVFVWDGPPRLALITCGGAFDWTARSYTDNIVVTATPIDDGEAPTPDGLAVAEPRRSS
jgi:sortase (surface protein transpeptidase)